MSIKDRIQKNEEKVLFQARVDKPLLVKLCAFLNKNKITRKKFLEAAIKELLNEK